MRFAQTEARLALAKLVHHFRFALVGASLKEPLPIRTGITISPADGMPMQVSARTPLPSFS